MELWDIDVIGCNIASHSSVYYQTSVFILLYTLLSIVTHCSKYSAKIGGMKITANNLL